MRAAAGLHGALPPFHREDVLRVGDTWPPGTPFLAPGASMEGPQLRLAGALRDRHGAPRGRDDIQVSGAYMGPCPGSDPEQA